MTRPTPNRAVIDDNPFTLNYHRTGAATSPSSKRRRARKLAGDFDEYNYNNEEVKDNIHPINNNRGMLLGENAVGCDWGEEVLLDDAKDADFTNKKIIFSYKAIDANKEIYIKSMSAVIRNILFSINISYTLIYKNDGNYEARVSSFTTSNAFNSKGKSIILILSEKAKQDTILDILEMNEEQVKYAVGVHRNTKIHHWSEIQQNHKNESIAS